LTHFCVGKSTAAALKTLIGLESVTGGRGAKELASQVIATTEGTHKRVIYLYGDRQATLPYDMYEEAGVSLLEVTCYSSIEVDAAPFHSALA
jgi:uroporphyrinogen-III synthase